MSEMSRGVDMAIRGSTRGSGRGRNGITLGKEKYIFLRNSGGSYNTRGKYVEGGWERFEATASVQGAMIWNRMMLKDAGDDTKETLSLRVNGRIYMARSGANGEMLLADRLEYQGALWEAKDVITYTNLSMTAHDEVLFVRLDNTPLVREGSCCD